ncbi:hypothetical protein AMTR_s00016p00248310 [Amborella trichopoda]|uniref:Uncharacterized protein n=1 Tax=Amborella trichopoda TaxID=13333 RepID=W1PGZ6_AMBTC|nr:hypothetical protein AMTR_s00016p00248310 [Amborella trichopoda]
MLVVEAGKMEGNTHVVERVMHVWFDSFHYTEGIHRLAAYKLWDGNVSCVVRLQPLKNFFNTDIGELPNLHPGRKGKMIAASFQIRM